MTSVRNNEELRIEALNAIFSVMAPGREYTRDDIKNRLKSRGQQLPPDTIKSALYSMARRGILRSDIIGGTPETVVYAIQEAEK